MTVILFIFKALAEAIKVEQLIFKQYVNVSSLGIGLNGLKKMNFLKKASGKRKYILQSIYFFSLLSYTLFCSSLALFWTVKMRIKKN